MIRNSSLILSRLMENTIVGICPEHLASYLGDSWFKQIPNYDFCINISSFFADENEEKINEIIENIKWFPIEYTHIKF